MEFKIDVHHHLHGQILSDLVASINSLRSALMAVGQDIIELSGKIDTATNLVATEITFLQSQIKNSMTDAEVATVKTNLQGLADRLTALGTDPNNPVPAPLLAAIKRKP